MKNNLYNEIQSLANKCLCDYPLLSSILQSLLGSHCIPSYNIEFNNILLKYSKQVVDLEPDDVSFETRKYYDLLSQMLDNQTIDESNKNDLITMSSLCFISVVMLVGDKYVEKLYRISVDFSKKKLEELEINKQNSYYPYNPN